MWEHENGAGAANLCCWGWSGWTQSGDAQGAELLSCWELADTGRSWGLWAELLQKAACCAGHGGCELRSDTGRDTALSEAGKEGENRSL